MLNSLFLVFLLFSAVFPLVLISRSLKNHSMSAHFGGEIPEEGIVGTLARAIPLHGCTKLNNTAAPNGQRAIVYMERDRDENVGCHFTTKVSI